jgi:type II secretory pathway predicted ATPase ExeA
MYEVFYKLAAEPFRLSPDHKFCFEHKSYSRAYAYMAYAFRRAEGFVMITGRPGTGKTTLIGDLVESLAREKASVAHLVCTQLQADDLLRSVAHSFGIESVGLGKADLLHRLTELLNNWQKEGRRALLAVDEAQDLSATAMEELRLLTNIQQGGQPLLQVFLLGQSELRDLIMAPEMEQVHQRIVAASHIEGLQVEETEPYIMHRLKVVNWKGDPAIDRAIFPLIHKFSEGIPRRVNLICGRLFLLGSVEERHTIDVRDVGIVIRELQGEGLAAGTGFSPLEFEQPASHDWVPVPVEPTPAIPQAEPQVVKRDEPAAADRDTGVDEKKKTSVGTKQYPSGPGCNGLRSLMTRVASHASTRPTLPPVGLSPRQIEIPELRWTRALNWKKVPRRMQGWRTTVMRESRHLPPQESPPGNCSNWSQRASNRRAAAWR